MISVELSTLSWRKLKAKTLRQGSIRRKKNVSKLGRILFKSISGHDCADKTENSFGQKPVPV